MNCREILKLISVYSDGELTDERTITLVESHLRFCPDCAAAGRQLRGLKELMSRIEKKQPPQFFEVRVLARLAQESPQALAGTFIAAARLTMAAGIGLAMLLAGAGQLAPSDASVYIEALLVDEPWSRIESAMFPPAPASENSRAATEGAAEVIA